MVQRREALTVPRVEDDLRPVLLTVWLGSVVRVAAALHSREPYACEAILAVLAVVFLPWIVARRRSTAIRALSD